MLALVMQDLAKMPYVERLGLSDTSKLPYQGQDGVGNNGGKGAAAGAGDAGDGQNGVCTMY
jgi:hypothetical protein